MKRLQWILIVVIITIFTSCIKSEPIPEGQSGMYGDSPKGMSRPAGMTADGEGKQRTGSAERKSRAPDEVRDSGAGESGLGNKEEKSVTGKVKIKLYKGNMIKAGAWSDWSLYSEEIATFGEDHVYNQADSAGFINLFGLPISVQAQVAAKNAKKK